MSATPKKLSELPAADVLKGHVVRVRDGAPSHTIRGNDLDAWRALIADKREGDRYYLVKPLPPIGILPPLPFRHEPSDDLESLRFRSGYGHQIVDTKVLERERAARTRRLRDENLIELDSYHGLGAEHLKPIDDAADRYAQMELGDVEPEGES